MRILILGSEGSLGTELRRVFPDATAKSRNDLDITDEGSASRVVSELNPEIIINAAAYTRVDAAETEVTSAFKVNRDGVVYLVRACEGSKRRIVHFSTDYVFDGLSDRGYAEDARTNPINMYGRSKEAGEVVLKELYPNHVLIRTSWLYGSGKSFPKKFLDMAKGKSSVDVVCDQFGRPTYAADLAERVKELINAEPGTYHVTNSGNCSWYEFAEQIVRLKNLDCRVNPITSDKLEATTRRPKYSFLESTKVPPMRHWRGALAEYLRALK